MMTQRKRMIGRPLPYHVGPYRFDTDQNNKIIMIQFADMPGTVIHGPYRTWLSQVRPGVSLLDIVENLEALEARADRAGLARE